MAERTVVTLGETLAALVEGKKYATLRDILVTMNAVDVAGIFEEMPEEKLPQDPSQAQIDAALEKESQAIRAKLPPSTSLVCLCVEGRLRSSEELSALVGTWEHSSAKHLAFVIGGSYGLAERLKGESWVKLSMSPMTFPHHLARVMLLEQLYRAFKIREGSSYHK